MASSSTSITAIDMNQTFQFHHLMLEYVGNYATNVGFVAIDRPKAYYKPSDWAFNHPFVAKTPKRGMIYCSPKSPGREKGSPCTWNVVYKVTNSVYVFLTPNSNLIHSHDILPKSIMLNGRFEVTRVKELTSSETSFIHNQVMSRVSMSNMLVHLETEFPSRSYNYELIRRVRDSILDNKYGKDRIQLHDLFIKGASIQKHGGIFVVDPSKEDFGIEAVHFQPSLFRKYAIAYGVNQLKMVDGTHHLSRHNSSAIIWTGVDCLLRTKFMGVTYAFSEQHEPIIRGARLFFPGDGATESDDVAESHAIAEFPGYFDPLTDIEGQTHPVPSRNEYTTPIDDGEYQNNEPAVITQQNCNTDDVEVQIPTIPPIQGSPSVKPVLMTDEGASFPLVCSAMGWRHILDRKHFTDQIKSTWQNVNDPKEYFNSIVSILDAPSVEQYNTLMEKAKQTFSTPKAIAFLRKIERNKHLLVFAFTSECFTAGHVSNQRSEGGMSAIKGKGTLKKYLRNATMVESLERISQTARTQDRAARDELKRCRSHGFMVGERYRQNLQKSIVESMSISYVSPISEDSSKHIVKCNEDATNYCEVNLKDEVLWNGHKFFIMTGTCPFYRSSLCICPCACAAAQRRGMDIKNPTHVHPRYLVGFHPLWPIALADLALADYEDAPWSHHFRITPATVDNSVLGVENNSEHGEILKARTQIFDSLSNMSQLQQSQRIVLVRNNFEPCLKLAGQSARQCKLACAYLIELQNRLKMVNMKYPSLCLKMSAVDSSLSRNANYLGINLANRNSSKSKKRKSYNETGGMKKGEDVEHAVTYSKNHHLFIMGIVVGAQSVLINHENQVTSGKPPIWTPLKRVAN